MHPIVVLLLDGLGDRAHPSLGGRTANEAAQTPNLDALAAQGSTGVLYAIGPGRAPSSEVAHWSMLGYRQEEFPNRAVLEALGAEQEVSPEDVFAFAALRPADRRNGELWLTGRPRYGEEEEDEAARLVERCADIEVDGLHFTLSQLQRGEAVLRVSGGADDRVTDSDAFFRDRHPVLRPQAAHPDAERTAGAAEQWMRIVIDRLAGERFNVITLKWWGRPHPVPTFLERHGVTGTLRTPASCVGSPAPSVSSPSMRRRRTTRPPTSAAASSSSAIGSTQETHSSSRT
jgi:2,3-bisphosphoglycerate-independent phosphoglycerate mutase